MSYFIEIAKPARSDLLELLSFLRTTYSPKTADKLKTEFVKLVHSLERLPFKFPKVDSQGETRKAILLSKTIVYYEVQGNVVTILSVRDGRRQNLGR